MWLLILEFCMTLIIIRWIMICFSPNNIQYIHDSTKNDNQSPNDKSQQYMNVDY